MSDPITLQITYTGQLAAEADRRSEAVTVTPSPLADILREVAHSHPPKFREILFDADGYLRKTIIVSVDDEQIKEPGSFIPATSHDILLMPPIAGG